MTCRSAVRRTMPATAKGQGHMCFLGLEGQAAKVSVWPLIECATCHRMASLGYLTMTATGNRFDCADHQPGDSGAGMRSDGISTVPEAPEPSSVKEGR